MWIGAGFREAPVGAKGSFWFHEPGSKVFSFAPAGAGDSGEVPVARAMGYFLAPLPGLMVLESAGLGRVKGQSGLAIIWVDVHISAHAAPPSLT